MSHANKALDVAALLASIRVKMRTTLAGFTADFPAGRNTWVATRLNAAEFPVPSLVLLALRDVMGFRWDGHGEKVRWSVYASVAGEPVVFELRKFGFTALIREGSSLDLGRVRGQLRSAIRLLEKALEPVAQAQINEGHVTIANRFAEFNERYYFFRNLAEEAYARAENPPPIASNGILRITNSLNHHLQSTREGFFYSTAMIDAYFSCLEHRLILLRAFIGRPLAAGELRQLLASSWDNKLKAVLDVSGDRPTELILGRLRRVKERIRNPFAHGGVENDGGSLFFHLPNIGAIPANFSRSNRSVRFNFIPIEPDDHQGACAVFDELDLRLKSGTLAGPHQLIKGCIDPAFDPQSVSDYAEAIQGGPETLEAYIESWNHMWERHTNMDY